MRRSARHTLTVIPAILIAALLIAPANAGSKGAEVDLAIKGGAKSNYVGVGIINNTGDGQVKSRIAKRGETDRFRVRYTNTGGNNDVYGFEGEGSKNGFVVRYEVGGLDITNDVTNGGYFPQDDLNPGESDTFRVFITTPNNAKDGAALVIPIRGFSKGGGEDTVKAKVTVKVGAGDKDSQVPA